MQDVRSKFGRPGDNSYRPLASFDAIVLSWSGGNDERLKVLIRPCV
jgi:hypothetical protein